MIVFLVEDLSMRKFLEGILLRLGFEPHYFRIKHHQGKEDLIRNLDKVVKKESKEANFLFVLVDQDKRNCYEFKKEIKEKMQSCACNYKIRIACYELEAWFLGDMDAIKQCSQKFKPDFFRNKEKYRYIDNIVKPSIEIETIVPDWKQTFLRKDKFAAEIAKHISLESKINKSHSFNIFLEAIKSIKV